MSHRGYSVLYSRCCSARETVIDDNEWVVEWIEGGKPAFCSGAVENEMGPHADPDVLEGTEDEREHNEAPEKNAVV